MPPPVFMKLRRSYWSKTRPSIRVNSRDAVMYGHLNLRGIAAILGPVEIRRHNRDTGYGKRRCDMTTARNAKSAASVSRS